MPSFDDDDDNASVNSSEDDNDENMDDVDDGDGDPDADNDAEEPDEAEAEGDEGDDDDDDDNDEIESPSTARLQARRQNASPGSFPTVTSSSQALQSQTTSTSTGPSNLAPMPPLPPHSSTPPSLPYRPTIRPEALSAPSYDIVPTIAAPQGTSINSVCATPDMRWVFSGGSDGYIRKFNWTDTANGKVMLTVAQRHPFVDSVTKAGVLLSYWENEEHTPLRTPVRGADPPPPSPVYSLAVQNQALWLLSGTESGAINVQSVRHSEGTRITSLREHTSAVSVLKLSQDERSALSGSWDKTILDWDLNTGQVKRRFATSGGQISALETRPISSLPVPEETGAPPLTNGTFSSNNDAAPSSLSAFTTQTTNGLGLTLQDSAMDDAPGSPDNDSLFGSPAGGMMEVPTMPGVDDDDDEFSRAMKSELQRPNSAEPPELPAGGPVQPPPAANPQTNGASAGGARAPLPHAEDLYLSTNGVSNHEAPAMSDSTFLDASIDGTIRVWDRRMSNPIARIRGNAPWCMSACWSPDGNFIYAGRRNNAVDEYSLHKGLREPRRTFRFPAGSGPVSAVRAMPNGKHLICASFDILRLYDLKEQDASRHSVVPFLIVPGHRTGVISQLYIDPTCSFLISTAGNRGWEGASTEVLLGYEIGVNAK
ncbi:WD40 repeat-like protein [Trichodelitschia bisporula]|uniref:WD40 repeat-like protein n=1 Tax=Trichodelitschia bisporula TaxID=703511 RepID=A0A6G1HQ19_9PEZI|nr:WD40 repeat-like protein [Trichodelitschia bisporula]